MTPRARPSLAISMVFFVAAGCGGGDDPSGSASNGNGRSPDPGLTHVTGGGTIGGSCSIFPPDNAWNRDVSGDPVDPASDAYMKYMGADGAFVHPDFGSDPTYGIPFVVVPGAQPRTSVSFQYGDESDPGPYPIPLDAPIEGGTDASGDRHAIAVDKDACMLYELFDAHASTTAWSAGSGAVFDLRSDKLRPDGWTSADAAGLPIFPGLVRYQEAVVEKSIKHALRFTTRRTQSAFIHPATHAASDVTDVAAPPMGLRLRLKASYDVSHFTGASLAVVQALKTYGMFVADNGSNWYISGQAVAPNETWDDDDLDQLKKVPASAFEVVQSTEPIRHGGG